MESRKRNLSWGVAVLAAAGIALALYSRVPATQTHEDRASAPSIATPAHQDPSLAGLRVAPDAEPGGYDIETF
jgi:hypothetical protein